VRCWDNESELAQYVATLHWSAVTAEARVALHPELLTTHPAQPMKQATFTVTH
jgi:hypothetical protein